MIPGLLSGFQRFAAANQQPMLQGAAGMMSQGHPLAGGFAGFAQGQQDQQTMALRQAAEERLRQAAASDEAWRNRLYEDQRAQAAGQTAAENATAKWAVEQGMFPDYDTAEAAFATGAGQDIFRAYMTESMKKKINGPEAPDLETFFDEKTGLEFKGYLGQDGQPVRVGGIKAPTKGMTLKTNPDGSVEFSEGGTGGLTTAAQTGIQTKKIQAEQARARVNTVRQSMKDEYLTLGGRAANLYRQGKAYVGGRSALSQQEMQDHAEFNGWKTKTLGHLNRTLNELSGAAVSPSEGQRLKGEMPNPNDDPATFVAKAEAVLQQLDEAIRLYETQGGGQAGVAATSGGNLVIDLDGNPLR
jgi:hypothetical protein